MKRPIIPIAVAVFLFSGTIVPAQDAEKLPKGLEDLKFRYDVEVTRVLDPIQRNYLKALEELQKRYTEAGDLEAVNKTREEIARARMWETLPIETMRRQDPSKMNQEEFGVWLRGKQLDFSSNSGPVTMTFDGESVNWKRGGRARNYSYTLTSNRRLTIKTNETSKFTVVFEEDFQAGTLESGLAKYDLKISDRK